MFWLLSCVVLGASLLAGYGADISIFKNISNILVISYGIRGVFVISVYRKVFRLCSERKVLVTTYPFLDGIFDMWVIVYLIMIPQAYILASTYAFGFIIRQTLISNLQNTMQAET